MTSWLTLHVTRTSLITRTSAGGHAEGQIGDLTHGFPAVDLAWFMETAEESFYGPEADRAMAVGRWARTLAGTPARLWDSAAVRACVAAVVPADVANLDIFICSPDAEILAFPWELIPFPAPFAPTVFGEAGRIERIETGETGVPPGSPAEPRTVADRTRILVVSPRPELRNDVPFTTTVGAAVGAAGRFPARLELEMARPPTFDALRRRLAEGPPPDILHFDGHGAAGPDGGSSSSKALARERRSRSAGPISRRCSGTARPAPC